LIDSIKLNTNCDVYAYTGDRPEVVTENIIKVSDITDVSVMHFRTFNYNLKGIITNHCYHTTDYDRIIFLDCDVMITQETDIFESLFNDGDFYAKYERFNPVHKNNPTWLKYKKLMTVLETPNEDFFLGMPYANESFFICNRSDRTSKFLKLWADICEKSSKGRVVPIFECVELGIALHYSEDLNFENLRGGILKDNMLLVTMHRGKDIQVVRR
jgi:hypothetical protein